MSGHLIPLRDHCHRRNYRRKTGKRSVLTDDVSYTFCGRSILHHRRTRLSRRRLERHSRVTQGQSWNEKNPFHRFDRGSIGLRTKLDRSVVSAIFKATRDTSRTHANRSANGHFILSHRIVPGARSCARPGPLEDKREDGAPLKVKRNVNGEGGGKKTRTVCRENVQFRATGKSG